MITEIATLNIVSLQETSFEKAFEKAKSIISRMKGFIGLELQKCIEEKEKYVLIVRWETLEDHTEGFRKHPMYADWKNLLHHFYNPFPKVEHFNRIF